MIISEELTASLDEPTDCLIMHRVEPSRLQLLALHLTDKLTQLADSNEQVILQNCFYFFTIITVEVRKLRICNELGEAPSFSHLIQNPSCHFRGEAEAVGCGASDYNYQQQPVAGRDVSGYPTRGWLEEQPDDGLSSTHAKRSNTNLPSKNRTVELVFPTGPRTIMVQAREGRRRPLTTFADIWLKWYF